MPGDMFNIRYVNGIDRARFRRGAVLRDVSQAIYFGRLLDLHDAMRERAAFDPSAAALLESLGLESVNG
jgi:hypothetical protein